MVKNQPANAEDLREVGSIPGGEDLLEQEMTTHSSILAWEVTWTEEHGGVHGVTKSWTGLKLHSMHIQHTYKDSEFSTYNSYF